jgi:predicted Zn-dependent peptidase
LLFQIPNDFGSILEREGAVGLNAATSQDSTQYYCSLPANKLELWMAMEAERFRAPVFRGLYSEKEVVLEERSARVTQAPLGRYLERYQSLAFTNNYRRPTIGQPPFTPA